MKTCVSTLQEFWGKLFLIPIQFPLGMTNSPGSTNKSRKCFSAHQTGMVCLNGLIQSQKKLDRHIVSEHKSGKIGHSILWL